MWYLILGIYLTVGWLTPWWTFIALAALGGSMSVSAWRSFRDGFLAIVIAWWMTCYFLDVRGEGIVSTSLGPLFGLENKFYFLALLGLCAGLVGAVSGALGYGFRSLGQRVSG
jgi:hypothetical protein